MGTAGVILALTTAQIVWDIDYAAAAEEATGGRTGKTCRARRFW